jgi:hypothetical protein
MKKAFKFADYFKIAISSMLSIVNFVLSFVTSAALNTGWG